MAKRRRRKGSVEFIREYGGTFMWIVIAIFAVSVFYGYGSTLTSSGRSSQDQASVLAFQVDNLKVEQEVLNHEYQTRLSYDRQTMPFTKISPFQKLDVRKRVLDEMVNNYILSEEAEKNGIRATRDDIQKEIELEKERLGFNQAKEDQKKDPKKDASLADWFKHLSEGDPQQKAFKQYVVTTYGSFDKMAENKRQVFLASHYQSRLLDDAKDQLTKGADKKADDVLARLNQGEKFDDLAAQLSEDPSAKTNKGDLGSFGRGRMVREFEEEAFSMKPGDIRKVSSQYGVHIIQVLEHKVPTGPDFEKQEPAIRQRLLDQQKKRNEANGITTPPEVTDDMIKRDYEQVHARHILFRVDPQQVLQQKIAAMRQKHNVRIYDDLYNFDELENSGDSLRASRQIPQANETYDRAINVLLKALEKRPDSPELNFFVGDAYQRKFEAYQGLVKQNVQQKPPPPPDPTLIKNMNDSLDQSLQYYKTAVEKSKIGLEPDPFYYLMLGRTYSMKGDMTAAANTYMEGLDYTGKDNMLMMQYKFQVQYLGRNDLVQKVQEMMDQSQKEQQEAVKKMNEALKKPEAEKKPEEQSTALPGAEEKKSK